MIEWRISLFLLALFVSWPLEARSAEIKPAGDWPEIEIRLSPEGTLKDIFDSGLRPYRFPSLESSMLEVKHVRAVVVQPDGFKLPVYEAQTITMGVRQGGLLGYLEFQNPRRTLEDSRAEMMRWIHLGNFPKRTEAELDEFLAAVRKDPLMYNRPDGGHTDNFRIAWRDSHQIIYNVWFHQIANAGKPLAVFMKIGFPRVPGPELFYSSPIPPPPGYEQVDMTAPGNFGPDAVPVTPEQEKLNRESSIPKETYPPGSLDIKPPLESYGPLVAKEPGQIAGRRAVFGWVAGAVALAAMLLVFVWFLKRRRNFRDGG